MTAIDAAGSASSAGALELLVFEVGPEELALDLRAVLRVWAAGGGAGADVMIDLRAHFGLGPSLRPQRLVVASAGAGTVGLLVDRIGETIYLSSEMVEPAPGAGAGAVKRLDPALLQGAVRLDGRTVLVLSPAALRALGAARRAA